jgi:acetylornithine/N-succinyldiaminopimelate aminotransferase
MSVATSSTVSSTGASVIELERRHLLQNYSRYPLVLHSGKGCHLYDVQGNRYLDLISGIGVNALGHAHPRIVRVIRDQAALLIHSSNLYYHEYQGPLAERLAALSGLERVFFSNSGTEAIEGALKMCRAHGGKISPAKHEMVAVENSFHGRSLGALSVTGQAKYRQDFEPLLPGVRFVPFNDIAALENAVSASTAGILMEWIQGEGGVSPVSGEFARKARELADRHNALLVADEIQCGLGRTGAYFGYQLDARPVRPDIALIAKPLAAGLPLGAILANEKAASAIGPGMHGSTFGGGALACRVALEFLDIMEELLPSIRQVGAYFRGRLEGLAGKFSFLKEVRGAGLMLGVEMTVPGKQMVLDAMAEGLLINCTHDTVLRFLPPYIITEREVDTAIGALEKVLERAKPGQ